MKYAVRGYSIQDCVFFSALYFCTFRLLKDWRSSGVEISVVLKCHCIPHGSTWNRQISDRQHRLLLSLLIIFGSVGTSVFRYPHFLESKCFSHPHPKHPTIQHPRHPQLDLPALTWRTFSAWRIAPCRPGCSMWRGGPCRGASPRARPSWARSHGGRGWHSPKLPKPWENCMDWMVKPPLKRDFRNLGPEWMSFWYRFSLIFYCFVVLFVLVFDVLSSTFLGLQPQKFIEMWDLNPF